MNGAADTNLNRLPTARSKLDESITTAARSGPLPAIRITGRHTRLTGIKTRFDCSLYEGFERQYHARPCRFAFQREGRNAGFHW